MYNVSEEYLTAIQKPAKFRRLTGTIGPVPFSDVNIAEGSFIIDNQCSVENEVKIGTVYMGQLTAVFRGINLTGQWQDKVITPSEGLLVDEDTFEEVPLGVFTVYEAIHGDNGVSVTAYDDMIKLDQPFGLTTTTGTPFDYLKMICDDCLVRLANTEQEIRAMPNGTKSFVLYADNDIETYRDCLSYVAQVLCGFATINRFGELEIRSYGIDIADTNDKYNRWTGATFSDFHTFYTRVIVTKIEDNTVLSESYTQDDGLTCNLGANPLLQYGNVQDALLQILLKLSDIDYFPFEITRNSMPAYDLGDVLMFEDGNGDGKRGCIMSYEYKYHGAYTIEGYGSNPALADVKSKQDKEIASLQKKDSVTSKIQIYTFSNLREIKVKDTWKELARIRFTSLVSTIVTLQVEIRLDAEHLTEGVTGNDIIGHIKYVFNNQELNYQPTETWFDGDHLLHLLYFFTIQEAKTNSLSIRMKVDNGEVTIAPQYIHAAVSGQGLASSGKWDGYIECEDEIGEITLVTTPQTITAITAEVTTTTKTPQKRELSDTYGVINLVTTPTVLAWSENMMINKEPISDYTWGEVSEYTWDEVEDLFYW